jgi:hypothetical protein
LQPDCFQAINRTNVLQPSSPARTAWLSICLPPSILQSGPPADGSFFDIDFLPVHTRQAATLEALLHRFRFWGAQAPTRSLLTATTIAASGLLHLFDSGNSFDSYLSPSAPARLTTVIGRADPIRDPISGCLRALQDTSSGESGGRCEGGRA